jgi:hypothetical protein
MQNAHPAKPSQTTRRSFVKLAAASVMLTGSSPTKKVWAQSLPARTSPLDDLPAFDGQLIFDDAARERWPLIMAAMSADRRLRC